MSLTAKLLNNRLLGATIKKIVTLWLQSQLRRNLLDLRYFYWRKLLNKNAVIEVFVDFNDPQSLLLMQQLPLVANNFLLDLKINLLTDYHQQELLSPSKWRSWNLQDAQALARFYHLPVPQCYPDNDTVNEKRSQWQDEKKSCELSTIINAFITLWYQENTIKNQGNNHDINVQIDTVKYQQLLAKGHYLPASIFYAGEWFVGIDRLGYLISHLQDHKLTQPAPKPLKLTMPTIQLKEKVAIGASNTAPLIVYLSLRSPYSYLGFKQAQQLAKYYQVELIIKPVLPLMMRNYQVPTSKMRYIFLDSVREAKQKNITFAKFHDPLGKGVEKCYQLFAYAQQQGKAEIFMATMFHGVYVAGVDLTKASNLRHLCQQLELDYQSALAFDHQNPWQQWAQNNLHELENLAFWGVPCFVFQGVKVWGQDRLWQIEQAILKQINNNMKI